MFTTVSYLVSRLPELDDHQAWEVFANRYTPLLQRYFNKFGFDRDVCGDLAQDTMQLVAEGLRRRQFDRKKGRLRDWIGGIARNVGRNHLRRSSAKTNADAIKTGFWASQEDPEASSEHLKADEQFDALWVRARLSSLLRLASKTFDQRELRCYFLVEIRRLPIREVARRTGLSESTVYHKRRQVARWLLAMGPRFVSRWEQ